MNKCENHSDAVTHFISFLKYFNLNFFLIRIFASSVFSRMIFIQQTTEPLDTLAMAAPRLGWRALLVFRQAGGGVWRPPAPQSQWNYFSNHSLSAKHFNCSPAAADSGVSGSGNLASAAAREGGRLSAPFCPPNPRPHSRQIVYFSPLHLLLLFHVCFLDQNLPKVSRQSKKAWKW